MANKKYCIFLHPRIWWGFMIKKEGLEKGLMCKAIVWKCWVKVANNINDGFISLLFPFPKTLREHSVPSDFFSVNSPSIQQKLPTCQERATVFLSFLKWGSSEMQPVGILKIFILRQSDTGPAAVVLPP